MYFIQVATEPFTDGITVPIFSLRELVKESRLPLLPGDLYEIEEPQRDEAGVYGNSLLAARILRGLIFTPVSSHDEWDTVLRKCGDEKTRSNCSSMKGRFCCAPFSLSASLGASPLTGLGLPSGK
jgi:hypothetical protein